MTQESNALGNIFYDYTYYRLAKKRYSGMVENNVTYHYGTAGTAKGRVDSVSDGTGRRALSYDALGNVVREERTLYVPGARARFFFVTQQTYDSWGRMRTLTYPDGEVVTYRYGYGGDLSSVSGAKGMEQHNYVTSVLYNAYGQRSRIDYGNGAYATYTYDALQRLSALTAVSASGAMQQISYTLDGLDNIVAVGNSATAIGSLGGTYQNLHIYDRLNRLTTSTGAGVCGNYTQDMEYSAAGRLAYKRTAGSVTGIQAVYGYCPDKPHAPRRIHDRKSRTLHDLRWDGAGNLGQTSTADKGICLDSRFLFWTEDNRLHTVVDGTNHSYYAYDYAGERTLKMTGKCTLLDINAEWMTTMATLDDVTLYPSPYLVLTATGYTKHYYIGNERLCARIGGGGLASAVQFSLQITNEDGLFARCNVQANTRRLELNNECCVQGLGDRDNQNLRERVRDIPLSLKSTVTADASSLTSMLLSLMQVTALEDEAYFYHGDHLGGASWITDAHGLPVQHLQYLPFGEPYVDQRTGGYSERFRFTGKELDPETGYSYFGARYLENATLTLWLSVDPMADKYPSISPYAYCAWNPLKLVDPNGREIDVSALSEEMQKRLVKCLGQITGLSLAVENGLLVSTGENSGISVYSKYAQSDLLSAIDDDETIYLYNSDDYGLVGDWGDYNEKSIYLSAKLHKGNEDYDALTEGLGMAFMHELGHAYFGDKDPVVDNTTNSFEWKFLKFKQPYPNENIELGDAVRRVNTYRSELGMPTRVSYESYNYSSSEPITWKQYDGMVAFQDGKNIVYKTLR